MSDRVGKRREIEVATATETGNAGTAGTTIIMSAIAMSADTGPGLGRDPAIELTGEGGLRPAREAGTGGVMMTTTGLVVENGATRRTDATNIITAGEKEMLTMSVGGDLTVARTLPQSINPCIASAFGVTVIKHHMKYSLGE